MMGTDTTRGPADVRHRLQATGVLVLLLISAICVAAAPLLMPESYSVVENAVSASAGQGIESAWVARTGFLMLGFGVLLLSVVRSGQWGVWGRLLMRIYGISIIAAAAYAHKPWLDVPFDEFEDLLHSVAASAVGFAFTVGVLFVTARRGPNAGWARAFDLVAVAAAVIIPMTMFNVPDVEGLIQRIMFAIGYVWYAAEAVRSLGDPRATILEQAGSELAVRGTRV